MAHLDVVPVEGTWQHDAFSGAVVDGQIWGRGTLDDKGCLVGICEAVETLLERGLHPGAGRLAVVRLRRGGLRHGGRAGGRRARSAAASGRGSSLDEGGAIAHDAFPGVGKPVGVVGVTEKGVMSIELRVEGRGGHASTPAADRTDRAAGPGDHPARPLPDAGQRPGADRRAVPPAGTARAAPAAAADGERRPARPGARPGPDRAGPGDAPRWPARRSRSPRCPAARPST